MAKEIDITKDLYLCSPLLNTKCPKTNCYINNGCCCHTVDKEYSQENLIEKEKDLSDRIVKVSRKIDAFKEKLKLITSERNDLKLKSKKFNLEIEKIKKDGCKEYKKELKREITNLKGHISKDTILNIISNTKLNNQTK